MKTGTEQAHKLLELLITKSMVSGKTKSSTIRLSYNEMAAAMGQPADNDIDLLIKLKLSWEHPKDKSND
jgi:hypothetical protein